MPDSSFALPRPTPWYRWIGPWPFRPVVTFFLTWYFFVVTSTGLLIGRGSVDPTEWLRGGVVFGIPAAGAIAIFVWLGRRWQGAHGVRPLSYVTFVFLGAAAALPVRALFSAVPIEQYSNVIAISLGIFRLMLMIFVIMAVAGAVVVRLQEQVNATQRALRQVREQQTIMVEADEATRRQVATLLHDRVQAGLIAACLELQMIAQRQDAPDQQSLRSVIARLEDLRALDVRRAARALSPSLEDVDLKTALEELAAQYEPSIETQIRVTPAIEERRDVMDDDLPIATYRIVEQALLNAATHGQAQHVWIDIGHTGTAITVEVRDDGHGLTRGVATPGLGTAVIETWTRALDGTWTLSDNQAGGATLTAHLPCATT